MNRHTHNHFTFYASMSLEQCLSRLKLAFNESPYAIDLLYLNSESYTFRIYGRDDQPPAAPIGGLQRWTAWSTQVTLFQTNSGSRLAYSGPVIWLLFGAYLLSNPTARNASCLVVPLWLSVAVLGIRRRSGNNTNHQNMVNLVKAALQYSEVQPVPVVKQLLN